MITDKYTELMKLDFLESWQKKMLRKECEKLSLVELYGNCNAIREKLGLDAIEYSELAVKCSENDAPSMKFRQELLADYYDR